MYCNDTYRNRNCSYRNCSCNAISVVVYVCVVTSGTTNSRKHYYKSSSITTHQGSYARYNNIQNVHFVSTLVTSITPSSRWSPPPLCSLHLPTKCKTTYRQLHAVKSH